MLHLHCPSRRTVIMFSVLAVVLAAGWFILGKTTFLARTAMRYAKPAIEKKLNAKLRSEPFIGNPFTGFVIKNAVLSQGGVPRLTVRELRVTFAVTETFSKLSPKIDLEADGARTSVEDFDKLIPSSDTPDAEDIIINDVTFKNSEIKTAFGNVKFAGKLHIDNSQSYATDIHGRIDDVADFSLNGAIKKLNGDWTADNLKLAMDKGTAEVNGAMYPNTDAKISTDKLNLSTVAQLFPKARALGIRGILSSQIAIKHKDKQLETSGQLSLQNALVRGVPIEELSIKWNYDKGLLKASFNDTGVKNSLLTGYVNFDGRNKNRLLDVDIATSQLKLAPLTQQFKQQLGGTKLLPSGTITGARVKLKGPLTKLSGKIELLPSDISYGDFSFKRLQGSAVFSDTDKGLVNFSTIHDGRPITLSGTLAFAPRIPTNLKFSAAGFRLEEFYKLVPELKKQNAKGLVALDASVIGTAKHWKLNAKVSSPQLTANDYGTMQNIRLAGNYLFENGNLEINSLSFVWNGANLSASGNLDNTKLHPAIKFKGAFTNMQTERFYKLLPFMDSDAINLKIPINGQFNISGDVSSPVAEANLNARGGTIMKGLVLSSASAKLRYQNSKIVVEPLTLVTPHGTLQTRVESTLAGNYPWSWEANFDRLAMRIINGIFGLNEDIRGRMSGKVKIFSVGHGLQWDATFNRSRFLWRTFHFDSFTGRATGTSKIINLNPINFVFCGGKGTASGSVTIGKTLDTSMINVTLNAAKINLYEVIRRHLPQVHSIQGFADTEGHISGSLEKPKFKGTTKLSPLRIATAYIPKAEAQTSVSLRHLHLRNLNIEFPEGSASGKLFLRNKDGKWRVKYKLDATSVDLSKLLLFADDASRSAIDGKVDIHLEADSPLDEFTTKGSLKSDSLRIKGLRLENLNAPFYYSDKYFVVEDLRAKATAGDLHGGFAYNTATNLWGAFCEMKGMDIEKAFKSLYTKDTPGKITGKADFKVRIGGESMQLSSLNAAGTLTATDGEISGFSFLESAKKFTKNKPIRFSKLQTTFRFDDDTLILLPGTQAVAPAGDSVYRMIMADGYITTKGDMSLTCLGKFNVRALNSILGAVRGIMDMRRTITTEGINNIDSKELLQSVLGGILGGATRSSFRFVTIGLGGKLSSPKLTKLMVEHDRTRMSRGTGIPRSNSDPTEKQMHLDGDITFNMHFELPVGPGKNSEPRDITGQVMQNTLKSLISNITF